MPQDGTELRRLGAEVHRGPPPWLRPLIWATALIALFAFRLFFGLASDLFSEDQTQVFLLGLRYYATGAWPYFGPDVTWTSSEIPGALQSLLVGVPFRIAPVPEAPYVLLNVLSMGCLCLFAWYLCERLRDVPRWLIWGWLLTVPWTLEYSTNIINTSYVLPAGLVFFVGFFEAWPSFTLRRLSPTTAHFLMGLALGWIIQVHMSGPILLPFVAAAFFWRRREGPRALVAAACGFGLGVLTFGSLLLPTLWKYGLFGGSGDTARNFQWYWRSPWILLKTVARFLSFPSLEVNRFVGTDATRVVFIEEHWPIVPLLIIVAVAGLVQPVWMAALWFKRQSRSAGWPEIRWLSAATVLLVYVSYFFVMEFTQARAYYVVAPLAFTYAAYCWTFIDSPRWRRIAAATMAVNICFQFGMAWIRLPDDSLYSNRPLVAAAISLKQPDVFARRRFFARDVPDDHLAALEMAARAPVDLEVVRVSWSQRSGVSRWAIAVRNRSSELGYRQLLYETTYLDGAGRTVVDRNGTIELVIQPGQVQQAEFIDGFVPASGVRAQLRILKAMPLRPFVATSGGL
jgi:hypothetical protein